MSETEGEEKKNSKSLILLAAIIAATAIIFALLLVIKPEMKSPTVTYNNFKFANIDGIWVTEWQLDSRLYTLQFRHNPAEVEDIPVTGTTDIRFQLEDVYITIDPVEERTEDMAYLNLAAIELLTKLQNPLGRNIIAACTANETEACADRPIITCDNTNSTVIYLKPAEKNSITLKGNCAIFEGKREGIVMAADKALFQWLHIIKYNETPK